MPSLWDVEVHVLDVVYFCARNRSVGLCLHKLCGLLCMFAYCFLGRYDWIKVATPVSDEDKTLVTEMWCSETTVEGKPVLDGKVFK